MAKKKRKKRTKQDVTKHPAFLKWVSALKKLKF